MIVFSHIRDVNNAGDMASCPAEWFDFPEHVVQTYNAPVNGCDAIVYGGGTMMNWLNGRKLPQVKRIGWGIGSSRHGITEPWPTPDGFSLLGAREWDPNHPDRWAPCASCMSPLFDELYTPEHEAVFFTNADPGIRRSYPVSVDGLPAMENNRSMGEIVAFLGSADVVVTNSYHGVFWATLLGRGVVCIPYSSKFYGFRHPPAYSADRGQDWRSAADKAQAYPEALAECRAATRAFYGRAMDILT